MPRYARVIDNKVRGIKYSRDPLPIKGLKKADGLFILRPIRELEKPEFNPETHKIRPQYESEMEIKKTEVIQGWAIEKLEDWERRIRIREKLNNLDSSLPRYVEDIVHAGNFISKLPEAMRERIKEKEKLRKELKDVS